MLFRSQNLVSSILEHTAADGKTYKTQFYNLDAIISVGYRVNSINATAFRRWATRVLNNYLLKGYSVNQQLLAMQRQFDSRLEEHSLRMTRIEDKQANRSSLTSLFVHLHLLQKWFSLRGTSIRHVWHWKIWLVRQIIV